MWLTLPCVASWMLTQGASCRGACASREQANILFGQFLACSLCTEGDTASGGSGKVLLRAGTRIVVTERRDPDVNLGTAAS